MEIKSISNSLTLSFLQEASSLEAALQELLGISKQKLKKNFSSYELKKKVKPKNSFNIPLNVLNEGKIFPEYVGPSIENIYEDDLVLALNKPTKIHTHPLTYFEADNVLSYLRQNREESLLNVNFEHYDRGMLYRLDYETSGLLLYVKQDHLYKKLRDQFHQVTKTKSYLCIVHGDFSKEGSHAHWFTGQNKKGSKQNVSLDQGDFLGELTVKKVDYNASQNLSLLLVNLKTGLRHQIRAQLAFLGYPIWGDRLYGGRMAKRLYLHAYRYKIEEKNFKYDFTAMPDESFVEFFNLNRRFQML